MQLFQQCFLPTSDFRLMQKCVCIYFGEERHMERDEKKVCVSERETEL